jgi:hypothetical protein
MEKTQGKAIVQALVKGGPAERSGNIRSGDVLTTVDGVDVRSIKDLSPLRSILLGEPGSHVLLGFDRTNDSGTVAQIVVDVIRGSSEIASLKEQIRGAASLFGLTPPPPTPVLQEELQRSRVSTERDTTEIERLRRIIAEMEAQNKRLASTADMSKQSNVAALRESEEKVL